MNQIDSVLPGQIPLNETPETIEPMDPKPSTSTHATQPSHSNDVSPEIIPQPSTSSESLSTVQMRGQKATPTSSSALPSTNVSTETTPAGISFQCLLVLLSFSRSKSTLSAPETNSMPLRINNEAYNPEIVTSGTYLTLSLILGVLGTIVLIIAAFYQFDSFDILFPFIPYITFSILFPLPIYMKNSVLRKFTYTSVKEMFSPN